MKSESNVVERAIAAVGGSPSELARRLSAESGKNVTRQMVHGYRLRGVFPREMIVSAEKVAKIPMAELAAAKVRSPQEGNIVDRACELFRPGATPEEFAQELAQRSGRKITRQMVNGWQRTGQFPIDVAPWVHTMTGIPIRELIVGKRAQNIVTKAYRSFGPEANAGSLAIALKRESGRQITSSEVEQWEKQGYVPEEWIAWVHLVSGLPVAELLDALPKQVKNSAQEFSI